MELSSSTLTSIEHSLQLQELAEQEARNHPGRQVLIRVSTRAYAEAHELKELLRYVIAKPKFPISVTIEKLRRLASMSKNLGTFLRSPDSEHVLTYSGCLISLARLYGKTVSTLDDAQPEDLREFMREGDDSSVRFVASVCSGMVSDTEKQMEDLVLKFQTIVGTTKDAIREQIVAKEYAKDKRLNKFEQDTHNAVCERVKDNIEHAWNDLSSEYAKVQDLIKCETGVIAAWSTKAGLFSSIQRDKPKDTTFGEKRQVVGRNAYHTASGLNRRTLGVFLHEEPRKHGNSESGTDTPEKSLETILPGPDPTKKSLQSFDEVYLTPPTRLKSPFQEGATPVNFSQVNVPREQRAISDSAYTFVSKGNTLEPPSLTDPTTESITDDNQFVVITKGLPSPEPAENAGRKQPRAYTVRFPPVDKKAFDKAFVGIDKYARQLFAKNPSPNAGP